MAPPSRKSSLSRGPGSRAVNDSPAAESPASERNLRSSSSPREGLRRRPGSALSVTSPESQDTQLRQSLRSRIRRRQAATTAPAQRRRQAATAAPAQRRRQAATTAPAQRRRRNRTSTQVRTQRRVGRPAGFVLATQPRRIRAVRPRAQTTAPQVRPRGRPRGRRNQGTQTTEGYEAIIPQIVIPRRRRVVMRPRNTNPRFRRPRANQVRAPRFANYSQRQAIRQLAFRRQRQAGRQPRQAARQPRQRVRQRRAQSLNVPRPRFSRAPVRSLPSFARNQPAASRAGSVRIPNAGGIPGMDMEWMRNIFSGLGPRTGAPSAAAPMPDPTNPMDDQTHY